MLTKQGTAHPPGKQFAYANFNYLLLGKIIEHTTKTSYEKFVQKEIQEAVGIKHMRLGHTLAKDRAPGEVEYFMPLGIGAASEANNVFPTGPKQVPWPYGGFYLEPMAAHGGWIASIVDMARWVAALAPGKPGQISAPFFERMFAADDQPADWTHADGISCHYDYGMFVVTDKSGKFVRFDHSGSLPGTFTAMSHLPTGASWVALFNQRSDEDGKLPPDGNLFDQLNTAVGAVKDWPKEDYFKDYPE
jgi:CubicO group peptidase (beta-lactamase class C family)